MEISTPCYLDFGPTSTARKSLAQPLGDQLTDVERCRCGRRGGVANVDDSLGFLDQEVVDQAAFAGDCLCSHPGGGGQQVFGADLRQEPLERLTNAALLIDRHISPIPVRQYFDAIRRKPG